MSSEHLAPFRTEVEKKRAKKPREVSEFAFFTRPKVCNREMAPKIKKINISGGGPPAKY